MNPESLLPDNQPLQEMRDACEYRAITVLLEGHQALISLL